MDELGVVGRVVLRDDVFDRREAVVEIGVGPLLRFAHIAGLTAPLPLHSTTDPEDSNSITRAVTANVFDVDDLAESAHGRNRWTRR